MNAGSDSFWIATLNLRSPSEIDNALRMLPSWKDPRALRTGLELIQRLRQATTSRREFDEAKHLHVSVEDFKAFALPEFPSEIEDAWRHYKDLNQALAPCPPDRTSTAVRANFAELKWRVLHPTNDQDLGLRQVEDILNLYSLVEHDEQKLDELESAGNRLLQLFVRGLRNGLPKRDPAPPQPPPPPPPPPKR